MSEFMANLLTEVAKDLVSKSITEGARALRGAMSASGGAAAASAASAQPVESDPTDAAQEVSHAFLRALADRNYGIAAELCEPSWAQDEARRTVFNNAFGAAPPVSWAFKELHAPEDWSAGQPLPWLAVKGIVTFDMCNGTYDTMLVTIWAVDSPSGWRVWNLEWEEVAGGVETADHRVAASSAEDAIAAADAAPPTGDGSTMVVRCLACSQRLRLPSSAGRLRVTCPTCGSVQFVGSPASAG